VGNGVDHCMSGGPRAAPRNAIESRVWRDYRILQGMLTLRFAFIGALAVLLPTTAFAGDAALPPLPPASASAALPPAKDPTPPAATQTPLPVPAPAPVTQQVPPMDLGPSPRVVTPAYGWHVVAADGTSLVLAGVGGLSQSVGVAMMGLAGYVLASPIVHWAHGNVGTGFASLGLRLAVPLGATFLGALLGWGLSYSVSGGCRGDFGCLGGFAVGGGIGFLAGLSGTTMIDALVFAKERVEDAPKTGVRWVPSFSVEKGGGRLTLGGTF
jgi:hypothetical protein